MSRIEPSLFSGLTGLYLDRNKNLTELNLAKSDLSSLRLFSVKDDVHIHRVSLKKTVLKQASLAVLCDGGSTDLIGISELDGEFPE